MMLRSRIPLALIASSFIISGCSMNLGKYDIQHYPKMTAFFEPITLSYSGKSIFLEPNLQRAYTQAIDTLSYPMESCRGVAHINASVSQDSPASNWSLGATLIPLWPAMPVEETWSYRMEVRIFCNGALTFKAEFDESEHVNAFWYGKMRSDLVNKASEEMHRKLIERLKFETGLNRHTDLNAVRDF